MKRVYKWDEGADFDFVEGCASGYVVWWNEEEYCIDTTKKPRELSLQYSPNGDTYCVEANDKSKLTREGKKGG
ncbi:MAG: hypothetical protein DRP42_05430 [Tenericutes bacterium]|nr:MAG: hypothetical protein DRP42_05430 [Mycoplasmatota bacterium]